MANALSMNVISEAAAARILEEMSTLRTALQQQEAHQARAAELAASVALSQQKEFLSQKEALLQERNAELTRQRFVLEEAEVKATVEKARQDMEWQEREAAVKQQETRLVAREKKGLEENVSVLLQMEAELARVRGLAHSRDGQLTELRSRLSSLQCEHEAKLSQLQQLVGKLTLNDRLASGLRTQLTACEVDRVEIQRKYEQLLETQKALESELARPKV